MFIGQCAAAGFSRGYFVREWSVSIFLLLILSILVFMFGSTMEFLLISRAVQGASVGILITIVRLLAFSITLGTPDAARSLGLLNIIAAAFALITPFVYSVIAVQLGWRYALLPVLIFCLIGLIYWPFDAITPRPQRNERAFSPPTARALLGLLFSASIFFLLVLLPITFVNAMATIEGGILKIGAYQSVITSVFMITSGMVFLGIAPYGFRTCLFSTILGILCALGLVVAETAASVPLIVIFAALAMGAIGILLSFSVALAVSIQSKDRFVAAALVGLSQSVAGFMAGLVPSGGSGAVLIIAVVFIAATVLVLRLKQDFTA